MGVGELVGEWVGEWVWVHGRMHSKTSAPILVHIMF